MQNSVTKNNALDFDDEQWSQLINANGLLIMWFIEWNQFNDAVNKDRENPRQIQDFFAQKYNMSAGCDPWPMKDAKISLDEG